MTRNARPDPSLDSEILLSQQVRTGFCFIQLQGAKSSIESITYIIFISNNSATGILESCAEDEVVPIGATSD
jgi:hypothetical protein